MATIAIPEDVAAHLQAAIRLSNRRLQTRLLEEAEAVLDQNAPVAALVIALAVLESALEAVPPERCLASATTIGGWRALRDSALYSPAQTVTAEQARDIVHGIRGLLTELLGLTDSAAAERGVTVGQVRGKYKHVPTSSEAFNRRKFEDLDLEH